MLKSTHSLEFLCSEIIISHGITATHLRSGGIFDDGFVTNLLLSLT